MAKTIQEVFDNIAREGVSRLTPEERVKGLALKDRLVGIPLEEALVQLQKLIKKSKKPKK